MDISMLSRPALKDIIWDAFHPDFRDHSMTDGARRVKISRSDGSTGFIKLRDMERFELERYALDRGNLSGSFYRYGLAARPFLPANCPDGFLDVEEFDDWTEVPGKDARPVRAIVTYDAPLTQGQVTQFHLSQIDSGRLAPDLECICHALTHAEVLNIGPWRLCPTLGGHWELSGPDIGLTRGPAEPLLALILKHGLDTTVDACL